MTSVYKLKRKTDSLLKYLVDVTLNSLKLIEYVYKSKNPLMTKTHQINSRIYSGERKIQLTLHSISKENLNPPYYLYSWMMIYHLKTKGNLLKAMKSYKKLKLRLAQNPILKNEVFCENKLLNAHSIANHLDLQAKEHFNNGDYLNSQNVNLTKFEIYTQELVDMPSLLLVSIDDNSAFGRV